MVTVFAAYAGESYADIPTVQQTVGFVPPATRAERERVRWRSAISPPKWACPASPRTSASSRRTHRPRIIGPCAKWCAASAITPPGMARPSRSKPARSPRPCCCEFLLAARRANLGINFDPANMILYGTGDPIAALDTLAPHVLTVHCKDGDWPPKAIRGALGQERPLGQGSVGMERFLAKLKEIGYKGPLSIEREASDPSARRQDIAMGVELLRRLKA